MYKLKHRGWKKFVKSLATSLHKHGVHPGAVLDWVNGSGNYTFHNGILSGMVTGFRHHVAADEKRLSEAQEIPQDFTEGMLDPMVKIPRSRVPNYPSWIMEPLFPELEEEAPSEVNISDVERWLHPRQFGCGRVQGYQIMNLIYDRGEMRSCLGLMELEAFQRRGWSFYKRYLDGLTVFAPKGAIRDEKGNITMPRFYGEKGKVFIAWRWLEQTWGNDNPILRYPGSKHIAPHLLCWNGNR